MILPLLPTSLYFHFIISYPTFLFPLFYFFAKNINHWLSFPYNILPDIRKVPNKIVRNFSISYFLLFSFYTNAAVMIAIEYTSSALHPRERSLIGAFSPNRIGPYASNPPSLCAILYPIFPALISGNTNTFA